MPNVPVALSAWPDSELLVAARDTELDALALEVLVRRHSRALERRCAVLTSDRDRAADLAQETWARMLRARSTVRADGSFAAYLATIALNLWRDDRRARGPGDQASEHGLLSLDAAASADEDGEHTIGETVAGSASPEEWMLLRLDLGCALERLPARLRAVVIARHVHGESAAEIGRRLGRTEQTVTAWLRAARTQMQHDLRDWRSAA